MSSLSLFGGKNGFATGDAWHPFFHLGAMDRGAPNRLCLTFALPYDIMPT
jgi:hypothetical protein